MRLTILQVMTSFIFTAFLTCFIAAIDLFCSMCESCSGYLRRVHSVGNPSRRDIEHLLRGYTKSTSQPLLSETKHRHPLAKLELVLCRLPSSLSSAAVKILCPMVWIFSHTHPRVRHFSKLSLDLLCDIQVMTATAILISGFNQLETMSYYHQQFVLNYWFLSLSSFWAARAGALDPSSADEGSSSNTVRGNSEVTEQILGASRGQDQSLVLSTPSESPAQIKTAHHVTTRKCQDESSHGSQWHYWSRTILIFCCLVLSTAYQLIVILSQRHNWNPVKEGKCFIQHDKSKWEVQFLWLAGTIIYASYLGFVGITGLLTGNVKFLKGLSSEAKKREATFLESFKGARRTLCERLLSYKPLYVLVYLCFAIFLMLYDVMAIFFDILAWGNSKSPLVVAFYFGFASWNTYSIIDMKISNVGLVEEDEREWGFGQVLAVGVLGLVFMGIGDAWKGE